MCSFVFKKICFLLFLFGLNRLDGIMVRNGTIWRQTRVSVIQFSGLTPLESSPTLNAKICAMRSTLHPASHFMCYEANMCTLYDFNYPANRDVDPGIDSKSCYTEALEEPDCDGRFYIVPGVGCITIEYNKKTHAEGKFFCASLGAKMLVPKSYAAMKELLMNTTVFPAGQFYWVGMEKHVWLDGTNIADEFWERHTMYEPDHSGLCGAFTTSPGYGLKDGPCPGTAGFICMK